MTKTEVNFILDALEYKAEYGHLFIDQYVLVSESGEWKHKEFEDKDISFQPTIENVLNMPLDDCFEQTPVDREKLYRKYLSEAVKIACRLEKLDQSRYSKFDDPEVEELRFFNFLNVED